MKTIKWLKISIVLQSIYIFSCIFSTVCFAINHYWGIYKFFSLGMLAIPGWLLNPTGILTIALGLSFSMASSALSSGNFLTNTAVVSAK